MQLSGLSIEKSGIYRIALLWRGFVMAMLLVMMAFADGYGQGNLMILPRRVVFEGAVRSEEITVANTGTDSAKYVVSLIQMRMKEDGSYEIITKPDSGQLFADKYLRLYPRAVTIPPKKAQVVKIQLLKSANMEPGEYRSHVYFRAVPKARPLDENTALPDSTMPVSARLIPVFGITIPVIIRVGESNMLVSISDMSFEMAKDTIPRFKLTFNRTGNFSAYGDMIVTYVPDQGKETKVGSVKGIGIYTPNLLRRFHCDLDKIPGIDYKTGRLHVVYTAPFDTKPQRLAEAEFLLK